MAADAHLRLPLADDFHDRALCSPVKLVQLLLHVSLQVPVYLFRGDVQLVLVLRLLTSSIMPPSTLRAALDVSTSQDKWTFAARSWGPDSSRL